MPQHVQKQREIYERIEFGVLFVVIYVPAHKNSHLLFAFATN